jgi:peptide/nickel transport system substrate-binding protein
MKRQLYPLLVIASLCLFVRTGLNAGTRPRYGGMARVQVRETMPLLDLIANHPSTALRQNLAMLVFDRLVHLDERGAPRPGLAETWTSDPQYQNWQFHLRRGVNFHDGSSITAANVVSALSSANTGWKVTSSNSQTIVIQTEVSTPHLPETLSLAYYSIYARTSDGTLIGCGPFTLDEFQPNRRLLLKANDDYWDGRPYLDSIDIIMGKSIREQLIDRRLDRDDVVELNLDQAKAVGWSNQAGSTNTTQHVAASAASDLYAVVFRSKVSPANAPATSNPSPIDDIRIRESLQLTIDRTTISSVLLQKQGDAARALLPQWLTGYEFLFASEVDLERARKLRTEAARNAAIVIPFAYDSGDSVSRAVAERIAVNAREAGITLQPFGEKNLSVDSLTTSSAQAVLVRVPMGSANPGAALAQLAALTEISDSDSAVRSADGPERLFAAEGQMLQDFRIIPIAHVPQIYWLSNRMRNWTQPKEGGWGLRDAWVETPSVSAVQR